jgi:hypothetical protein
MPKPPVLVVDEDPITSRVFNDVFILEERPYKHEPNLGKALTFLRQCREAHIVIVRYVMPGAFRTFDWYTQLAKTRSLQRHAYIEVWHCYDAPEDKPHWPVRKRFDLQVLSCPDKPGEFLDALESACVRLMR